MEMKVFQECLSNLVEQTRETSQLNQNTDRYSCRLVASVPIASSSYCFTILEFYYCQLNSVFCKTFNKRSVLDRQQMTMHNGSKIHKQLKSIFYFFLFLRLKFFLFPKGCIQMPKNVNTEGKKKKKGGKLNKNNWKKIN